MDVLQEYWEEDRGMVIGGAVVGVALVLVLVSAIAALVGGSASPSDAARVSASPTVNMRMIGSASVDRVAGMARISKDMGKVVVDRPSSSGLDVRPLSREELLGQSESSSASSSATSATQTGQTGQTGTSTATTTLDAAIAALPEPATSDAIMGRSMTTVDRMVAVFEASGKAYPSVYASKGAPTIRDWCQQALEEATAEGVRAEVLFAQAMHETGYLGFGGQVDPSQCNFGGLGATNDGAAGATFADVRTGLRAQVQHLKAYASTDDLNQDLVDGRFDLVERGCAPTVEGLGGRWAVPGDTYGQAIMEIVNRLVA